MGSETDTDTFEAVDWGQIERSRQLLTPQRVTLVVGLLVLGALFLYDSQQRLYLVFNWQVERIDWLFLLALLVVVSFVVVPLLRRRDRLRQVARALRSHPVLLLASGYLGAVTLAGIVGPAFFSDPLPSTAGNFYNPPFGFTVEQDVYSAGCAGQETGSSFDRTCTGGLEYPLGTGELGERVELLLLAGARPTVYVAVIGIVAIVPIATAVGVAAGLQGGLVDKLLMAYVDLQLSVPAILIYVLGYIYLSPSLSLLLVAFGLFSWGGLARLVRSETIQRREYGHVTVARSLGASELYVARRHIVPNITNTLVPAIAHLLALLVLYEAGVAFLGFYELSVTSWGSMISESINAVETSPHLSRAELPAHRIWWLSTFPAVLLGLTILSLKLLGDGLRDALDPRGSR